MNRDPAKPYAVIVDGDRWAVVYDERLTVCTLRDEASAQQYAVLCNEAWRRGYKRGYKDGRLGEPPL